MVNIHDINVSRTIKSEYRKILDYCHTARVVMRYDDNCGNGHNTFSITVDSKCGHYGGCMHDAIRKVFPELAHLIKWHLMSTDGPLHYVSNTLYHAQDGRVKAAADSASLKQQLLTFVEENGNRSCRDYAETYCKKLRSLEAIISIASDRLLRAEGPNLEAARRIAVAPDATIEQLQDEDWLTARLPGLLADFKATMEATFEPS